MAQRGLVDKKQWLTREEFVEDWAVAQILPGPNVVNLSLILGDRYFGLRGALAAVAGMLLLPLVVVLMLAALFSGVSDVPAAQGVLRGMGAVTSGLIFATAIKLMPALGKSVMGVAVCVVLVLCTFVAIAFLRIPLVWVLLSLGVLASSWAWYQLGRVRDGLSL